MHTVPQTQTNSVSLYLHYFFRLKIGKIQKYVFLIMNIQIIFARFFPPPLYVMNLIFYIV